MHVEIGMMKRNIARYETIATVPKIIKHILFLIWSIYGHTLRPTLYVGVDSRKQLDPRNFSLYLDDQGQALFH